MENKKKSKKLIFLWIITGIMICATGLLIFFFVQYNGSLSDTKDEVVYDKYYAMITEDPSSLFWESVYEAASKRAEEGNAYVENFPKMLVQEYDIYEMMKIAIASGVDGIIVSADESEDMEKLINEATLEGIPVVTVLSDNSKSERISYVGVGNYNLGREYGKLISDICNSQNNSYKTMKVTVLMDSEAQDTGQNVLYGAIQEYIDQDQQQHPYSHTPVSLSMYTVDSVNSFSVEESVRGIFSQGKANIPDIIVCLSEIDTTSVYQAVVDFNEVGNVSILGYYNSEAILKGIERNVINSTISIDTEQLGKFCIDAISEFNEMGYTSQYFTADISIINKLTIRLTKEGESDEE